MTTRMTWTKHGWIVARLLGTLVIEASLHATYTDALLALERSTR